MTLLETIIGLHPVSVFTASPVLATVLILGTASFALGIPAGLGAALSGVAYGLAGKLADAARESVFCDISFRKTLPNFHYEVSRRGVLLWKDSHVYVDHLGHPLNPSADFNGSYLSIFQGIPLWCFFNEGDGSTFRTFRPLRSKLLERLRDLAYELDDRDLAVAQQDVGGMVSIYYQYREGGVLEGGHRNLFCRSWNTLNVEEGTEKEIREWLDFFSDNPRHWRGKGLGWHTGIVLHGPPGNGKSSIAKALAYEYNSPMYTINLRALKDEDLPRLPSSAGIYLIEDFSAINMGTQTDGTTGGDHVSLSGLLNFIDGAWTPDGAIFIMTCNVLPALDEALQRPGRMDKIIYVGNATRPQIEGMWRRLHPECPELAERFAAPFPEDEYSMAQIENMILSHREAGKLIDLVESQLPPPYNVGNQSLTRSAKTKGKGSLVVGKLSSSN